MDTKNTQQECCPPFDSKAWTDKIFLWENKKFVKGKVFTLFNIPINFGSIIRKLDKKIRDANATILDGLCLSDHTSKWNMDIYLAVDKDIPEVENTVLNGKFLTKVYEGSFNQTASWCKDYEEYCVANQLKIKKWYMWYTTCPKCAKKYGKNYVVIICNVV